MKRFVFNRKPHPSEIIGFFSVSVIFGVLISFIIKTFLFIDLIWVFISIILFLNAFISKNKIGIVFAVMAGIIFGLWRGSNSIMNQNMLSIYLNKEIVISGFVNDEVTSDSSSSKSFYLDNLQVDDQKLDIKIKAIIINNDDIQRNDYITIKGTLQKDFAGNYNITGSLENSIIRDQTSSFVNQIKNKFINNVSQTVDEPSASLGLGFLIGKKSGIDQNVTDVMKIVGLTHVIVASGYNLTILVRLCRRIFNRISKYTALMSSFLLIVFFISIAGLGPSTLRAALVTFLSLIAWYYGRKFNPFILISLVAAVSIVLNPAYLSGDLGWQLSFAAFFGILIIAPIIRYYYFGKEKIGFIAQLITETISAIIMTAPIIAYAFGYYSIIALLANVILLPLVPLSMLFVFLAGIGFGPFNFLGYLFGKAANLLINYFINTAQYLASISWSQIHINLNIFGVISCYLIIATFSIYAYRKVRSDYKITNIIE